MNIAGLFGFLNNILNVAAEDAGRLEQLIHVAGEPDAPLPAFQRPQGDTCRACKRRPAVTLLLPYSLELDLSSISCASFGL